MSTDHASKRRDAARTGSRAPPVRAGTAWSAASGRGQVERAQRILAQQPSSAPRARPSPNRRGRSAGSSTFHARGTTCAGVASPTQPGPQRLVALEERRERLEQQTLVERADDADRERGVVERAPRGHLVEEEELLLGERERVGARGRSRRRSPGRRGCVRARPARAPRSRSAAKPASVGSLEQRADRERRSRSARGRWVTTRAASSE